MLLSQLFQRGGGGGSGNEGSGEDKMVVHVLDELALHDDGLVMDIRYTIRENKLNKTLRQEFLCAFLPVFGHDVEKVSKIYEDYCEGKYVPNITVAIEAFIAFLTHVAE
uniref:Uncharacterized protein n=1 Tax=Lygus hesperus TaxID=30085 RepID=A0A0A9VVV3_LYGHE